MLPHDLLASVAGTLVGFVLGLVGGGGSILAVPLLVYLVGVKSPHVAIGTSAVAVALSALMNLWGHARQRHVKWRCAVVFAAAGTVGAVLGSSLGKQFDGQKLLVLFGVLMVVIAAAMVFKKAVAGDEAVRLDWSSASELAPMLLVYGVGVGVLSGFFGIGGGFLIVPGLMAATNMPLLYAIGS
ncbi:MAG: sulfite exporter TauE/SafE family protein, partial [Deltaproteobacteria bacterium]